MRKVFSTIVTGVFLLVFGIGMAVVMLDWMGGCGETYVNAQGQRIPGECVGRDIVSDLFARR